MNSFHPFGGSGELVSGENSAQRGILLTFSGTLSVYNVGIVMDDEVILG